jgi:hypothetical protein
MVAKLFVKLFNIEIYYANSNCDTTAKELQDPIHRSVTRPGNDHYGVGSYTGFFSFICAII